MQGAVSYIHRPFRFMYDLYCRNKNTVHHVAVILSTYYKIHHLQKSYNRVAHVRILVRRRFRQSLAYGTPG